MPRRETVVLYALQSLLVAQTFKEAVHLQFLGRELHSCIESRSRVSRNQLLSRCQVRGASVNSRSPGRVKWRQLFGTACSLKRKENGRESKSQQQQQEQPLEHSAREIQSRIVAISTGAESE